MIKEIKQKIFKTQFTNKLITMLAYGYVKLIEKTTKWQYDNYENLKKELKAGGLISCAWHSRVVMMPAFKDNSTPVNALVSLHRDGQIIADLLKKFKFNIIGGSSSRNSKAAAINILRCLENKENIAITPDGPRGPAQKLSASPIYFAHKTGRPIIAVAYSVKKAIIIKKSWDNLMVPLPFSRGAFVASDPYYVPANATDEELEMHRQKVEKIINQTTQKADKLAGRK